MEIALWISDTGKRMSKDGRFVNEKALRNAVEEVVDAMQLQRPLVLAGDRGRWIAIHPDYTIPRSRTEGFTTSVFFSGLGMRPIEEGEVDEEFGLPQHLTNNWNTPDADLPQSDGPVQHPTYIWHSADGEMSRQFGQRLALRWYAARSIYPLNSTKRKRP